MKQMLLMLVAVMFSAACLAAEPVSLGADGMTAIAGKDTTAYHQLPGPTHPGAVPGSDRWVVEYKGARWRFASKESSEQFAADPARYAPSYNGHCANALSLGEGLIPTDGTHWEIFDNKLYLFYAARGRDRWLNGDWKVYKAQADEAWATLSQ